MNVLIVSTFSLYHFCILEYFCMNWWLLYEWSRLVIFVMMMVVSWWTRCGEDWQIALCGGRRHDGLLQKWVLLLVSRMLQLRQPGMDGVQLLSAQEPVSQCPGVGVWLFAITIVVDEHCLVLLTCWLIYLLPAPLWLFITFLLENFNFWQFEWEFCS